MFVRTSPENFPMLHLDQKIHLNLYPGDQKLGLHTCKVIPITNRAKHTNQVTRAFPFSFEDLEAIKMRLNTMNKNLNRI